MKQTSRREFLKLAGKGMLGAAALSTVPAMLPALAEGVEAPAWPWAYKKLDKDAVMKHGYECFYSHGGCCAGAVAAVVELLAEEYGYPYNQLNARMFADGAGGYGAATLCGSSGRRVRDVRPVLRGEGGARAARPALRLVQGSCVPELPAGDGIRHHGFGRDRVRGVRRELHEGDRLRDGRSGPSWRAARLSRARLRRRRSSC